MWPLHYSAAPAVQHVRDSRSFLCFNVGARLEQQARALYIVVGSSSMQRIAQRTGVGSSTSDNIVTNTSGGGDSSSSSKRWVQGDDCQKKNERPHWHFWREVASANTLAAAAGWSAAFVGGRC